VSIGQVLVRNPEVIVTIDANFFNAVWRDTLCQAVAAARAGRVHLAPGVPFGWIDFLPSTSRLIGPRSLARALHPDAFPEDLRPTVCEFFARVHHRTPTDAQLAAAERRRP
jgi:iron complex transport system substrate-binding protein